MAECITPQWDGRSAPQAFLAVHEKSSTGNTVTLQCSADYFAHGYAAYTNGIPRNYTINVDGQTRSGSFNINGVSNRVRLIDFDVTVSKHNAARDIGFSISFNFDITWSGMYAGTLTASDTARIPARTSNTVSYDANGGYGAPAAQTKWYGDILTLSTIVPSRPGYAFQGWGLSASTSEVSYRPGDQYGEDTTRTLYAVWKAGNYTVRYNANGGTGAPQDQIKIHGESLTLSSTKPIRANYNFLGWGTSPSSSTVAYSPGSSYNENSDITLYAIWQLGYSKPRITEFTADRCDSGGTLSEEGKYAIVKYKWQCDSYVRSMKIEWKPSGTSSYTNNVSVSGSGTKGSISKVIGNNALDIETSYDVRVTVTDGNGSNDAIKSVSTIAFDIDLLKGGGGVAIGMPASKKGFEVGMETTIHKQVTIKDFIYDQFGRRINNGLAQYESSGINPDTTLDELIITNRNTPTNSDMYIQTMFYESKSTSSDRAQIAVPCKREDSMYYRWFSNGFWSKWVRNVTEDSITELENTIAKLEEANKEKTWNGSGRPYGNQLNIWISKKGTHCICDIEWIGETGINKHGEILEVTIPAEFRPFKNAWATMENVSSNNPMGITRICISPSTGKIGFVTDQTGYVERYVTFSYRTE